MNDLKMHHKLLGNVRLLFKKMYSKQMNINRLKMKIILFCLNIHFHFVTTTKTYLINIY